MNPSQQPTNPFAENPAPMLAQVNPYAAPSVYDKPQQMKQYDGGVWQAGSLLVIHRQAVLPPVCVKSGLPATTWLPRNLSWHPPWCYLGLLLGLIPFVILALIMTKRATIQIGLTDEWAARRKFWIFVGWMVGLAGLALFIGGIVLIANEVEPGVIGIPVGLITAVVGLIIGNAGASVISPKKIDDTYIWIKGVNPAVLAMFPHWQG
jgi:hypothetical protein